MITLLIRHEYCLQILSLCRREPEIKGTRSGGGAGDGNTSDDDSVLFSGKVSSLVQLCRQ